MACTLKNKKYFYAAYPHKINFYSSMVRFSFFGFLNPLFIDKKISFSKILFRGDGLGCKNNLLFIINSKLSSRFLFKIFPSGNKFNKFPPPLFKI